MDGWMEERYGWMDGLMGWMDGWRGERDRETRDLSLPHLRPLHQPRLMVWGWYSDGIHTEILLAVAVMAQ